MATTQDSGLIRGGIETLQETVSRLRQETETVTRTARLDISGSGVDEIDPPEDLDEYWKQYQETGIVRSNINQFVSDVVEPGVRVTGEHEPTVNYFMGGDDAPAFAPEGGFLKQCAVYAGERHQPFYPFLKTTIANRWVRGTVLTEYLKDDRENPESRINGFYHIPPETVYPQVYSLKNILLDPDPDAPINEDIQFETTRRGEVAAYIQFDDRSIIGRRTSGMDEPDVPLSQNDVQKQVLNPDIGGSGTNEQGVFGESVLAAVSTDISEYKGTLRDRYRALQTKAYGIWLVNFNKEALDLGENQTEVVEWDDAGQDDVMSTMEGLGPGEYISADGPMDLEKFEPDIPDLSNTLDHYVDTITAPLPAPKFSVGFEEGINQFVTENQQERYRDIISEERKYQSRKWTNTFRLIAERHPELDPTGLRVVLEPEQEESPIRSLTAEEIEKIDRYATAVSEFAGPTLGPTAILDEDFIREEVLQVGDEAAPGAAPALREEMDSAEAQSVFDEITGAEAMQEFSDAEVVDTPDGVGIIDDIITEGSVDGMDATSDEPVYAVVVEDESVGVGFYREGDLSSGDLPEAGPDNPEGDLEAMLDIYDATEIGAEVMQEGFFEWPESWEESEEPARSIALRAWAGMGGSFRGCRREMTGNIASPSRFCADFKDRLYGTELWRGGWAD